MSISVVTHEDLKQFKIELLSEIRALIPSSTSEKRWIRSSEVRSMLDGISAGKLQMMRDKGEIPFTKIGGTIFYDLVQIEKCINKDKYLVK